jgi:glucosamine 6-phosphate synthetase-like amidotransferase/phosphosugar isomerase protein
MRIHQRSGVESGGVAYLTYLATQIALLKLCEQLGYIKELSNLILLAAEAIADITDRKEQWLPQLINHVNSPFGTYFIAPNDRICSAQQSALMMRECPRLPAVACETGDWSHIDVYLTKTIDYHAILFPGSIWQEQLFNWTTQRQRKVVTIGFEDKSAAIILRYKHDIDPIVRLLAEITFIELLAQKIWQEN